MPTEAVDAVHCITFGSAAIASVPNHISSGRPTDRVISFVNLKDPVPRADLAYALWAADALGKYLTRITGRFKSACIYSLAAAAAISWWRDGPA